MFLVVSHILQIRLHTFFKNSRDNLTQCTAQKMKFSIKDYFSKCDQIRSFLRIWSHLLKKSLMENFIFCAVMVVIPTNNNLRKFLIEQVFFDHRATVLGFLIFNISCFDVILHTFCIKRTIKEFIKFIELQ